MKIIDRILFKVVKNNFIWSILKPVVDAAIYIQIIKDKSLKRAINWGKYNNLFTELTVMSGPFKGMMYPNFKSVGSALYPKLLGSYERELHQTIEELITTGYSELIDVGCAEGYYAVGFALRNENLKVYAYDTDNQARELCKKMSILNKVNNRIVIKSRLDDSELSFFKFSGKSLIICDTEGFEKKLFTSKSIENLKYCDLLIETHDYNDLEISSYLFNLFKKTHEITVIQSVDDVQKVKYYNYSLLDAFSLDEKKIILSEHRSSIMEWFLLKSKNN